MFSCCSVQFMLLLFMVHQLQATENISCKNAITDRHLQFMDELIDSQLQSSCKITFDFVDPVQLTDDVCYIQAAFELLNEVFNTHMKFKKGSLNFNNTEEMKNLFDELLYEDCIPTLDKGCCKQCAMTFTMSHQEMLEMVKVVFLKSQKLLQNTTIQMKKNCMEEIAQCRRAQQPPPSGPTQCDCSCPSLQNLTRGDSTFLLTTSSTWEHLPNVSTDNLPSSTVAPTVMPACQGSSILPKDVPDATLTPFVISETELRDYSSGQGSFKSPEDVVVPSFILSAVTAKGQDPHVFSTESTLVPETPASNAWSSSDNVMKNAESTGPTAGSHTAAVDSSQPMSGAALLLCRLCRTNGQGSRDKAATQQSLLEVNAESNHFPSADLLPQKEGPAVPLSRDTQTLASTTSRLSVSAPHPEDPAKDSTAPWKVTPTILFQGAITDLEQLITRARSPTKRHISEFRSKGGGESMQRSSEREEHSAGPRSEFKSFSDTGKQGREMAQTESQSKVFLSCVLPMLAGLLLVLCGLLYYRHKSKNLKQTLERMSRETEPEERPLNGQLVELQVQGIV
ncbi:macrophage colony-stimulating factor 1 isoform X1 [Rhinatrema bivittatum]|uniref:macrophage colony-stimulating factor 1 isoform X1 n=1 Tax=Rhinatrema bivittatum TaxID=194408 RepID=UPI00112DE766|nr:macrophage colony-stimulating factor 1 isoform X1 [Rhinatrema bivittatum]